MASAAVRSEAMVLLFITVPSVCGIFVFGPGIEVHYFVSCVVLQSSRWRKESYLSDFYYLLDVMLLLLFFTSSPRSDISWSHARFFLI